MRPSCSCRSERYLPVREKDFLQTVRKFAEVHGWWCYHTWSSIHSPSGFPDLVLLRPPRIVFAELKSERGRLTPAQEAWLQALQACPQVEVYVWRPSDWDTIEEVLKKQ